MTHSPHSLPRKVAALIPGALTFGKLLPTDPFAVVRNVVDAVRAYPLSVFDLFLYPFPWNRANDVYHVVVAVLAVIGAIGWLARAWARLLPLLT